ncbi:MAG: ABC transporter permease, partial [Euryarchaeota archaeon]|nr:ABC transporter permease [Euryarchaeota archaeon]
ELMQRFNEGVASLPFLPILILISVAFKPSIWNIIIIMSCLYWTGTAKVARSMGLQIKEETYIEAARCLGAGNKRIILKHMIPQVIPYAFAQMALMVPSALLTEAGLSFLGVGDPTALTWGQILHDAQFGGATLKGLWWWVIPPGLAIAAVGLTFVMIGTALDAILNPKMRRR